jgi:hypothetical protein
VANRSLGLPHPSRQVGFPMWVFRCNTVTHVTFLTFPLAARRDSWQKAFSLRVKKEFIFNPADGGQENLGRQRNGGCQFDKLPIRGYLCRLRQSLET